MATNLYLGKIGSLRFYTLNATTLLAAVTEVKAQAIGVLLAQRVPEGFGQLGPQVVFEHVC